MPCWLTSVMGSAVESLHSEVQVWLSLPCQAATFLGSPCPACRSTVQSSQGEIGAGTILLAFVAQEAHQ